ncbi:MAG: hypothetical protein F4Y16_09135 [Holophagales bacterium]|nr:hypothetical protein [Holophagales bacterium]MYH24289.1 hypothetical protein [Holophagales bacterium]
MTDLQAERLELYKVHAELADRVGQRRAEANKLHVSLISGLAALFAVLMRLEGPGPDQIVIVTFVCMGILLSVSWLIVIRSYRRLNGHKFAALHEMERELAYPFFTREWELRGESKFMERYWRLTVVETILPWSFLGLALLLLAWSIFFRSTPP